MNIWKCEYNCAGLHAEWYSVELIIADTLIILMDIRRTKHRPSQPERDIYRWLRTVLPVVRHKNESNLTVRL